jgi:hypothetical protein
MSKDTKGATYAWLDKLIGQEVVVMNRSEEDRFLGILRHVDLDPLKGGLGPTAVLQNSAGRHAVIFDVAVISDDDDYLDVADDEEDEDDEEEEEEDGNDLPDDHTDDDVVKF